MTNTPLLSNEELFYTYKYMSQIRDTYEKVINSGFVIQKLAGTNSKMIVPVSDEDVDTFKSSPHYLTAKNIVNKLGGIVELIIEAEPEMAEKVNSLFEPDSNETRL